MKHRVPHDGSARRGVVRILRLFASRVRHSLSSSHEKQEEAPTSLGGRFLCEHHVVVCNVNEKAPAIVEQLRTDPVRGPVNVVVIVQDEELWDSSLISADNSKRCGRVDVVHGCPADRETLRKANICRARAAVILADPKHGRLADARSTLIGMSIERENPGVHTVMELIKSVNRNHLRATRVDEVVCFGELSEKLLSQSAVTPGVSKLFNHLLSSDPNTGQVFVHPILPEMAGRTYRDLSRDAIRKGAPYLFCGFFQKTRSDPDSMIRRLVLNPPANTEPGKDTKLREGDSLIVISSRCPDFSSLCGK